MSDRKSVRKPFTTPENPEEQSTQMAGERPTSFVAMIPMKLAELIPDWDSRLPEMLKHFPVNILFSSSDGLRSVLYVPDFYSFDDGVETAILTYRTVLTSEFRVEVALNKSSGAIETRKYNGDALVRLAHGADFVGAMRMTTMWGVDGDEPVTTTLPM